MFQSSKGCSRTARRRLGVANDQAFPVPIPHGDMFLRPYFYSV